MLLFSNGTILQHDNIKCKNTVIPKFVMFCVLMQILRNIYRCSNTNCIQSQQFALIALGLK